MTADGAARHAVVLRGLGRLRDGHAALALDGAYAERAVAAGAGKHDADGALVAQVDGLPMPDARRTTDTWRYPDEILIGSLFTLMLPPDLPTGDYRLVSGFYRLETGERFVVNGVDRLPVFTLKLVD